MPDQDAPPPPQRGRPRDPTIRLRVLPVAAEHFAERGYEALTIEGVVAGSGVAKQTVYRWWPTKSALVSDAILGGYVDIPSTSIPRSGDLWADLEAWLGNAPEIMQGLYGEILRATMAIGVKEPSLGTELAQELGGPALRDVRARLEEAVLDDQVSSGSDLDATAHLLMALFVQVGTSREDTSRARQSLEILRSGISRPT